MEASSQSSSQQILWKDVEAGKEKKAKYHTYQRVALVLALLFLVLALCVFSLRYLWSPSLGKVYDHQYKAVLDGVERDGLLEIDPGQRIEIFRMGNGSEEVLEVHDFKNGITGIRFAEHQRCYIRTQTRKLPTVAEVEAEDTEVDEIEAVDMKVEDSQVWVPAEEPIVNPAFLFDSKIWEICQELPIHWIHPSPLSGESKGGIAASKRSLLTLWLEGIPTGHVQVRRGRVFSPTVSIQSGLEVEIDDAEVGNEDAPGAEVAGQRFARDVLDHPAVNDYRDAGIELDNRLDDNGYCCQHCRRGYRFCRRYHEPLGGFNPWPYYYQGGRVICQVVMPCNWWIARMLGRI